MLARNSKKKWVLEILEPYVTAVFYCLAALKLFNNIENIFVCGEDLLTGNLF